MPSEQQLSDVLSEFARTMLTNFPIQGILDHLVRRIVDVMPISAAGVTLISPGTNPRYVAASDESALRFEELQTELGEGPCLVAYQTGEAVAVADLRDDRRFLLFAPRAVEAGLAAVFTFPLHNGAERLGALDLYRTTPGLLDAGTMDAAQTLADVAASYLLNARARTELRESSEQSHESAMHDALTGLPNRTLFLERLDHAMLRARRSGKMAAVLFADLDRFKEVNDQHGHSFGDELLVAVAQRLSQVLRPGDTLARLSGDEFVILCEDLDEPAQVDVIAARIGKVMAEPIVLSDVEMSMTASVGIAFSGPGDQLSGQLLQEADTAMYQAKRKGGARHQVVDLREQDLADEKAELKRDLSGAPGRGELRIDYQPIVETTDGRITGVEAFLRWAHPSRGLIMPSMLIPLAERSGLIAEIGRWVLEHACPDQHRWQNLQPGDLTMPVNINVSAQQLMSLDYAAEVADVLSRSGTDPELVTLEVTESAFVQDSERARIVLTELKRIGVRLALDDFGAGYSSLNSLRQFPIDVVKVDQGFVADLEHERASHAIVGAVVAMAHTLGMKVVAEGVETVDQHRELASLGCDSCQGYYFARPMPAGEFETLLQQGAPGGSVRLPALANAAP
jgi:diguanylate cyclase (GGDEF)-like protein